MQKKLILFTADFPFGTGETFLETEIHFLAKGFDSLTIITQNRFGLEQREIPVNCEVVRIDTSISTGDKLMALLGIFGGEFWKERRLIRSTYQKKLSKGIVFTMLISLYRAKRLKKWLTGAFQETMKLEKQLYYSYWCEDTALALALLQQDHPEITTVCRAHGWDVYFEASSLNYLPFRHVISNHLTAIFPISEKGKTYMREVWKIPSLEKVHVARLGVEEQTMLEAGPRPFILVSCSNVIPLKRVDLIAKALKTIEDTDLHWVHFGDGPQMEVVKAITKELPTTIHVEWKGRVSNKEVLNWYRENKPHLFINVSTTEGIPVSIMEAMSFGIPVIATNVGGTGEIVSTENGLLLSSDLSVEELAAAIKSFATDTEFLVSKRSAAFETWRRDYDAAVNYENFVQKLTGFLS